MGHATFNAGQLTAVIGDNSGDCNHRRGYSRSISSGSRLGGVSKRLGLDLKEFRVQILKILPGNRNYVRSMTRIIQRLV